jgi:hypoxanthine-guanine phosphoribosyltransferase/DNA-binding Lrp family transcriptional regulator
MKKGKIKQLLLELVQQASEITPLELIKKTGSSPASVYLRLKELVEEGKIFKRGSTPTVVYSAAWETASKIGFENGVTRKQKSFIDDNYYYVTEDGRELFGLEAFGFWANLKNPSQKMAELAARYIETRKNCNLLLRPDGYLELTGLIKEVFKDDSRLKGVYASDFYTLPHGFGKSKLGAMVYYAKDSQVTQLIYKVANLVKPTIEKIITNKNVTAVAFLPHSKKRTIQFMSRFKEYLNLNIKKEVVLGKIYPDKIRVEQKSLKTRTERIKNAQKTIVIKEFPDVNDGETILIIDDVLGTGSSIHCVASKIKDRNQKANVIAYVVVGNVDGRYDVIKGA